MPKENCKKTQLVLLSIKPRFQLSAIQTSIVLRNGTSFEPPDDLQSTFRICHTWTQFAFHFYCICRSSRNLLWAITKNFCFQLIARIKPNQLLISRDALLITPDEHAQFLANNHAKSASNVKQKRFNQSQFHLTMSRVTHSKAEHDFMIPLSRLQLARYTIPIQFKRRRTLNIWTTEHHCRNHQKWWTFCNSFRSVQKLFISFWNRQLNANFYFSPSTSSIGYTVSWKFHLAADDDGQKTLKTRNFVATSRHVQRLLNSLFFATEVFPNLKFLNDFKRFKSRVKLE